MRLSRAAIALALSLTAVLGGVAPASALSGVPGLSLIHISEPTRPY